jgi:hypothetical protein
VTTTPKSELESKKTAFRKLLDSDVVEPDVQRFLEEHTELFPLPWRLNHSLHNGVIISKFPLDTSIETDFAYLTKSSVEWYLVLVEVESPKKVMFKRDKKRVLLTPEFAEALDQIAEWKMFIWRNRDQVMERIAPLLRPLSDNRVRIKYVLIYGRHAELSSQEKIDRFADLSDTELKVITYDSLISKHSPDEWWPKNVLVLTKRKFEFKYLHQLDTHIFAFCRPSEILLQPDQRARLISDSFDIESWEAGKFLTVNQKNTNSRRGFRKAIREVLSDKNSVAGTSG